MFTLFINKSSAEVGGSGEIRLSSEIEQPVQDDPISHNTVGAVGLASTCSSFNRPIASSPNAAAEAPQYFKKLRLDTIMVICFLAGFNKYRSSY